MIVQSPAGFVSRCMNTAVKWLRISKDPPKKVQIATPSHISQGTKDGDVCIVSRMYFEVLRV